MSFIIYCSVSQIQINPEKKRRKHQNDSFVRTYLLAKISALCQPHPGQPLMGLPTYQYQYHSLHSHKITTFLYLP